VLFDLVGVASDEKLPFQKIGFQHNQYYYNLMESGRYQMIIVVSTGDMW